MLIDVLQIFITYYNSFHVSQLYKFVEHCVDNALMSVQPHFDVSIHRKWQNCISSIF